MADRLFRFILVLFGLGLVVLLVGLVMLLFNLAEPLLGRDGFSFFLSQNWDPSNQQFGALSFLYGTLVSSLLSLVFAVPMSLAVSLFLTQYSSGRLAKVLGFLVEMLAAIPSVIYGLWGIFILSPFLNMHIYPWMVDHLSSTTEFSKVWAIGGTAVTYPFASLWNIFSEAHISPDQVFQFFERTFDGPSYGVGLLTAALVLAVMITPTITAISKEIFLTVPDAQKEASLALGSTRWEMIWLTVIKSCRAGIVGAIILGLGRALGETMAVTMVIGNRNEIDSSVFSPAQTMASIIANEYQEASGTHLAALAAVGLGLLIVSLTVNFIARGVVWYSRSRLKASV